MPQALSGINARADAEPIAGELVLGSTTLKNSVRPPQVAPDTHATYELAVHLLDRCRSTLFYITNKSRLSKGLGGGSQCLWARPLPPEPLTAARPR